MRGGLRSTRVRLYARPGFVAHCKNYTAGTSPAATRRDRVRLLDRIDDGLADLLVLTGGAAAAADRADDLAVRKQRQPAFDGNRAGAQGQKHGRRAGDGILELLGRTAELGGRFGLANRYVAGAELGVLHASEIDQAAL